MGREIRFRSRSYSSSPRNPRRYDSRSPARCRSPSSSFSSPSRSDSRDSNSYRSESPPVDYHDNAEEEKVVTVTAIHSFINEDEIVSAIQRTVSVTEGHLPSEAALWHHYTGTVKPHQKRERTPDEGVDAELDDFLKDIPSIADDMSPIPGVPLSVEAVVEIEKVEMLVRREDDEHAPTIALVHFRYSRDLQRFMRCVRNCRLYVLLTHAKPKWASQKLSRRHSPFIHLARVCIGVEAAGFHAPRVIPTSLLPEDALQLSQDADRVPELRALLERLYDQFDSLCKEDQEFYTRNSHIFTTSAKTPVLNTSTSLPNPTNKGEKSTSGESLSLREKLALKKREMMETMEKQRTQEFIKDTVANKSEHTQNLVDTSFQHCDSLSLFCGFPFSKGFDSLLTHALQTQPTLEQIYGRECVVGKKPGFLSISIANPSPLPEAAAFVTQVEPSHNLPRGAYTITISAFA